MILGLHPSLCTILINIPSRDDVEEIVINEEVIEQGSNPLMVIKQEEAESA